MVLKNNLSMQRHNETSLARWMYFAQYKYNTCWVMRRPPPAPVQVRASVDSTEAACLRAAMLFQTLLLKFKLQNNYGYE